MGLFSFFNRRNGQSNGTYETGGQSANIPKDVFVEEEPPTANVHNEKSTLWSNESSIQILFHFLDRNHEQKGYDDALINPDSSHLKENVEALKNELHRTINKVKTFYEDFIREIDFHIQSRSRNGMVDTVEELQMKRTIAQSHIDKVKEVEDDALNNTGASQGIVISYTRGFRNGLAAISHHSMLKRKF